MYKLTGWRYIKEKDPLVSTGVSKSPTEIKVISEDVGVEST